MHSADARTLHGFSSLYSESLHPLLDAVAGIASPRPYAVLAVLLTGCALVRRRWRVAVAVPVVLVGAAVSAEPLLKSALAAPRHAAILGARQVADASFPSGHAAGAMALALCAILVAPPRLRPYVAPASAALVAVISYAVLAQFGHYPSDLLGGYLVAGAWASAGVGVLTWLDARWPAGGARQGAGRVLSRLPVRAFLGTILTLALAAAAAAATLVPERASHFMRTHPVSVLGACVIAAASFAVAAAVTAISRDNAI